MGSRLNYLDTHSSRQCRQIHSRTHAQARTPFLEFFPVCLTAHLSAFVCLSAMLCLSQTMFFFLVLSSYSSHLKLASSSLPVSSVCVMACLYFLVALIFPNGVFFIVFLPAQLISCHLLSQFFSLSALLLTRSSSVLLPYCLIPFSTLFLQSLSVYCVVHRGTCLCYPGAN